MKTRVVAVVWSRCRAILRRWLRFAWMDRLPLWGPPPWRPAFRRSPRRAGEPPTHFHPSLEILEKRWTPDDILSAASAPVTMGGLVLLAGSHITPMRLLLDSAPPAADAPAPQPDTSAAPYHYTEPDDPLLTDGGFDDLAFFAATGHVPADEGLAYVHNTPSDLANPDEPAKEMAVNDGPADGFLNSSTAAARAAKAPATTSPPSPPAAAAAANSPAKYAGAGGGGGGGGSCTPNAGKGGGGPTGGGSANLHLPSLTSLQQFLPGNDTAIASNATAAPAAASQVQFADNAAATSALPPGSAATPQSSIGPSGRETAAPPAPRRRQSAHPPATAVAPRPTAAPRSNRPLSTCVPRRSPQCRANW